MNVFDSRNSWKELSQQLTRGVINLRRCSADFRMDHYLGVDDTGKFCYLLRMPSIQVDINENMPTLTGCTSSFLNFDNGTYFCITLREQKDWQIFKLLCRMLIESLERALPNDNLCVIKVLKDVIKRCGKFFKKSSAPLSRQQAQGLLGELLFLRDYAVPVVGWESALACWKGPMGAPQDFTILNSSVETKTTILSEKPVVTISNLEQLSPLEGDGYLLTFCLSTGIGTSEDSLTLKKLVEGISDELELHTSEGCTMFQTIVRQLGYSPTEREALVPYAIVDAQFYYLKNGFPRITPAMVPPGITDCKYKIDLNYCQDFTCQPHWIN